MDRDDADVPPYYETLGIDIQTAEAGYAAGFLPADDALSLSREETILHGGAIASLADATGYWAVSSANDGHLTPTIDLRIDFLAPATGDLLAEAEVVRNGSSVGVADVLVETGETTVATARGVFKTGGSGSWNA